MVIVICNTRLIPLEVFSFYELSLSCYCRLSMLEAVPAVAFMVIDPSPATRQIHLWSLERLTLAGSWESNAAIELHQSALAAFIPKLLFQRCHLDRLPLRKRGQCQREREYARRQNQAQVDG